MTTSINSHKTGPRRAWRLALAGAAVVVLGGIGAAALVLDDTDAQTPSPPTTIAPGLPGSPDAAEHWLSPESGPDGPTCRPDAAQRWQVPNIAVADLPHSADAAEHWLTPEIAVADLPHSADAAEHWLCAP